MKRILLATGNSDKIVEMKAILDDSNWELLSLSDFPSVPEVIEDGETLEANALKKARNAFEFTGIPSLADDTGLEVDALNGAPGVYSSRFAGEDVSYRQNNEKLLKLMKEVEASKRTAQFRCVVAYADGNQEHIVEGVCRGIILDRYYGSDGFGYDPVFYVPDLKKTFAELSLEQKNSISHRGLAFRNIALWLEQQKY